MEDVFLSWSWNLFRLKVGWPGACHYGSIQRSSKDVWTHEKAFMRRLAGCSYESNSLHRRTSPMKVAVKDVPEAQALFPRPFSKH